MNSSQPASFGLPQYFRAYGFLFFMAGAFFHCMDFLGVEYTIIWGMGLTFLGALLLSVILWSRYAINGKLWKYLV